MEIDESSSFPVELEDMENYSKSTMKRIAGLTKLSNSLPADKNYALYSSYSQFREITGIHAKKSQQLLTRLLRKYNIRGNLASSDVQEKLDIITEANDQILESINGEIDVMTGVCRRSDPVMCSVSASVNQMSDINTRWNLNTNRTQQMPIQQQKSVSLLTAHNVERPQLSFVRRIDNSANTPFVPIITDKPHALRPLAILLETHDNGTQQYSHPYEFELERFEPAEHFLTAAAAEHDSPDPPPPASCDLSPVTWVATVAGLDQLVRDLSQVNALAVDLEHHSYRSYQGITCLIQISSRQRDFIVDALALRDQLQPLNELFTNPRIVKVLHGAEMDVQWLQRDCGVYLVHLFDTHQAARTLNFPRLSLAYLLQHFCNVQPDKRLQLADWRVRPLTEEMLRYAQQDTHYLLYIYDRLRALLLEKGNHLSNLLSSVYKNSTQICLKRYEKPVIHADSHLELYRRSRKMFNARQLAALASLYKWRDETARESDESTHYVLPNHMLLHIAEVLPREMQGIIACCNPVPPLVRQNTCQIHQLILAARAKSPLPAETVSSSSSVMTAMPVRRRHYDADHLLNAIHDEPVVCAQTHANTLLSRSDNHNGALMPTKLSLSSHRQSSVVNVSLKTTTTLDFAPSNAAVCGGGASVDDRPTTSSQWISPYCRYHLLVGGQIDDKGRRLMDDLTDSTPNLLADKAAHSSASKSSADNCGEQQLHKVLPEVKTDPDDATDGDEDAGECDVAEESAPRSLRISRKEKARELKRAGVVPKARGDSKRRKKNHGKQCTVPLSTASPSHDSRNKPSSPVAVGADAEFDYSRVDYDALLRRKSKPAEKSASFHMRKAGGRSRINRRSGGRFQVFGGGRAKNSQ